jgi:ACS family allantoate permease-like MFS transporter
MLVGLPGGFLQIFFIWFVVVGIRVTNIPRSYWGVFVCLIPLAGNIGILTVPASNRWGIVICVWLASVISPVLALSLSLIASNIKGNTKRSTVSNMYFVTYAIAAIAAPQLWLTTEAPRFRKGLITNMVSFGGLITLFFAWNFLATHENKKRDRLEARTVGEDFIPSGDSDVTDKLDLAFRYTA